MSPELVLKFDDGFLRVVNPVDVHDRYVAGLNDHKANHFLKENYLIGLEAVRSRSVCLQTIALQHCTRLEVERIFPV